MLDLVVQLLLHQMFNIEPIAFAAGNSSTGSMGLFQQTDVLQYGHLIADGCAGTVEVQEAHQRLGADRLSSSCKLIYDCLEDVNLPLCQHHRHSLL